MSKSIFGPESWLAHANFGAILPELHKRTFSNFFLSFCKIFLDLVRPFLDLVRPRVVCVWFNKSTCYGLCIWMLIRRGSHMQLPVSVQCIFSFLVYPSRAIRNQRPSLPFHVPP
ncbi:unnamed protein product [Linum tenue]|uniref:Uncharacterized protein n=1 Tax=Linum tenue TaxID=586396 RepID=A0AAV0S0Y0_9ROSI|nr:unnamed protein product [Linum tenue]